MARNPNHNPIILIRHIFRRIEDLGLGLRFLDTALYLNQLIREPGVVLVRRPSLKRGRWSDLRVGQFKGIFEGLCHVFFMSVCNNIPKTEYSSTLSLWDSIPSLRDS